MADLQRDDRTRLEIADGIAKVRMVREAQMNAFDEAMHVSFRDAFDQIRSDDTVRAVILIGSGRAFCAGQDLGERARTFEEGGVPDLSASLGENYNPLIRTIADLPMPVIAAVNGIAFGAGAALAIACDIVIAADTARFQFGFINVGLGPDSGVSWSLARSVGQVRALDLALTGRAVLADEALSMGLVGRVVPLAELETSADALARDMTARSAAALSSIKRQLRTAPGGALDAALYTERDEQSALGQTQEYREAVLRFAQQRR